MAVKFKGEATLDAGVAPVDGGVQGALDALDLAIPDLDLQVAANPAVGAEGADLPVVGGGLGAVAVDQGVGGAGLDAGATGDTGGVAEGLVGPCDDPGREPASGDRQDLVGLQFVAGPDAAVATDALGHVGPDVGVAQVRDRGGMAGARGIAYRRDAEGGEGPLEFGGELARSRLDAVGGVIGEHQFEDVLA